MDSFQWAQPKFWPQATNGQNSTHPNRMSIRVPHRPWNHEYVLSPIGGSSPNRSTERGY